MLRIQELGLQIPTTASRIILQKNEFISGRTGDGVIYNPNGLPVAGTTLYNGIGKRTSDVFLSKTAFVSKDKLFLIMQHEYIHVSFNYAGASAFTNSQEVAAYNTTIRQAQAWGYDTKELTVLKNLYESRLWSGSPSLRVNFSNTIRIIRPW